MTDEDIREIIAGTALPKAEYSRLRAGATSTGDLTGAVRKEIRRLLAVNDGQQNQAMKAGLRRMVEDGSISSSEARVLSRIVDSVLVEAKKKNAAGKEYAKVRDAYHELLADSQASPVALAIASAANSSFAVEESDGDDANVARVVITPETTGAGAVVGGVIGGIMGFIAGGPAGAAIGAGIGAGAGAGIGACNEKGK